MKKTAKKKLILKFQKFLYPFIAVVILLVFFLTSYQAVMADKYYPFTYVGDTKISFLTVGQATRLVQARFEGRLTQKLEFVYQDQSLTIDLAKVKPGLDYSAISREWNKQHKGNLLNRAKVQLQTLFKSQIQPKVQMSAGLVLDDLADEIDQLPQNAILTFDERTNSEGSPSAHIEIKAGKNGISLDKEKMEEVIAAYLLTGKQGDLKVKVVPPQVTTTHLSLAKKILEKTVAKPIALIFEDKKWVLDAKQLLTILDLTAGESLLDKEKAVLFFADIAKEIDREVAEGLFEFNPVSKRVSAFRPSQEGKKLDVDKAYQALLEALAGDLTEITLPVEIIKPKITTSDVNSLGIKELLGRGISRFAGSIQNRIFNIGLAASRINGILIAPGEEFSFNRYIGDISSASGYRQAYVIKEGRTVLDDGGGVCQVSTTVFRAALNSGLPVTARTAHAYRVSYYEQGFPVGLDATIWTPSVDLKFKNDTGNHILLQAYTVSTTLYVDLYGTSDGRVATISKPTITNQVPPPPAIRQDDPTLPAGEVKQVDWAAWGASVRFSRTVSRGEETLISETFYSNYRPWAAVYLVGTKVN